MQVRAAKLTDMPCTSMAVLQVSARTAAAHPTILCGSYDNKVRLLLSLRVMQFHCCVNALAKMLVSLT